MTHTQQQALDIIVETIIAPLSERIETLADRISDLATAVNRLDADIKSAGHRN